MKSDFCCDAGLTERSKKKGRMFLSFLFLGALLLAFTPTAVFAAPGDVCVSDAECPGGTCDFGATVTVVFSDDFESGAPNPAWAFPTINVIDISPDPHGKVGVPIPEDSQIEGFLFGLSVGSGTVIRAEYFEVGVASSGAGEDERHDFDVSTTDFDEFFNIYAETDETNYILGDGFSDVDTGIARTVGWHEFTFVVTAGGTEAYIDGTLVGLNPGLITVNALGIKSEKSPATGDQSKWDNIEIITGSTGGTCSFPALSKCPMYGQVAKKIDNAGNLSDATFGEAYFRGDDDRCVDLKDRLGLIDGITSSSGSIDPSDDPLVLREDRIEVSTTGADAVFAKFDESSKKLILESKSTGSITLGVVDKDLTSLEGLSDFSTRDLNDQWGHITDLKLGDSVTCSGIGKLNLYIEGEDIDDPSITGFQMELYLDDVSCVSGILEDEEVFTDVSFTVEESEMTFTSAKFSASEDKNLVKFKVEEGTGTSTGLGNPLTRGFAQGKKGTPGDPYDTTTDEKALSH